MASAPVDTFESGQFRRRVEALAALALVAIAGGLLATGHAFHGSGAGEAAAVGASIVASTVEPPRGEGRGVGRLAAPGRADAPTLPPRVISARPRRDPRALRDFERCYGPTALLLRPPAPLCLHPPGAQPLPTIIRHPPRQT